MKQSKINQQVVDFLVLGDFVSQEDIDDVLKVAKDQKMLEDILVERELIKLDHLSRIIAEANGWKFIVLANEGIDQAVMKKIPESMARSKQIIAFAEDDNEILVATTNPENVTLVHTLEKKFKKKIVVHYASEKDLSDHYYLYKSDIKKEFEEIFQKAQEELEQNKKKDDGSDGNFIIEIVDMLLDRGYEFGASDIHIEPQPDYSIVRFRIDGIMNDILEMPKQIHGSIIARIKVMARLRTDEHQSPQDGKIRYAFEDEQFDIRVSMVPTIGGENVVMRYLSDKSNSFSIESMDLDKADLDKAYEAIKNPWGLILVTGPTGSGKTTSLYSFLKVLNVRDVNIATIEDPVERNIEGITQIQTNPKGNLTFATGLRALVRQDPDIIMVGEIRDPETANIAVNSAMTGHLVLSTLHTNDAATSIPRLLDMGVEPFLISSTIAIVVAQRLVRKICPKCIYSYETTPEEMKISLPLEAIERFEKDRKSKKDKITLFKGDGCKLCHGTGYHGRVGVFEILKMDNSIRKLIMEGSDADKIKQQSIENGMQTMFEDGYRKVLNGTTTMEEVLRVIKG